MTTNGPGGATWRYDAFGRTTTFPDTAGATIANTFYVNDLIAEQHQAGVGTATWALNPGLRRRTHTFTAASGGTADRSPRRPAITASVFCSMVSCRYVFFSLIRPPRPVRRVCCTDR
jgi:hypothetical protein